MRRARVFISCGQRSPREIAIGKAVEDHFSQRGFLTYFAERVHSSDALTTNIFGALKNSEYFVFLDFCRDVIDDDQHRGSLFVNQELAIATYLGLTGVGFCEKGVKREGILQYHIYNEHSFEDGTEVIAKLKEITADWDPTSVNELEVVPSVSATKNVELANHPGRPLSDWYHLVITNHNKRKHAFDVHGYVAQIIDVAKGSPLCIPTNELVWSGLGEISVNILSDTSRELDAFFLVHGQLVLRFHQRPLSTSNPEYSLPELPPGKYEIRYTVISSTFETASQWFTLQFTGTPKGVTFEPLPAHERKSA